MKITFMKGPDTHSEILIPCCSKEMKEEDFAFLVAAEFLKDPQLGRIDPANPRDRISYAIVAHILDVDISQLPIAPPRLEGCWGIQYSPDVVEVDFVSDGRLVRVDIGSRCGSGGYNTAQYHFRRLKDNPYLKYLPLAEKCDYQVMKGSDADPWIYLFPERFNGVAALSRVLMPRDENPLTGLVQSKDAPVRTLARQVIRTLTAIREDWIREIISTL